MKNIESRRWSVYIVRCADDSLYTGITTDVERRLRQHNCTKYGAKYTRPRRPVCLVYQETADTRSEASKREKEIKNLTQKQKLLLIAGQ